MSEPEQLYVLTRGEYSNMEVVAGALDEATLLLFVAGLGAAAPDYDIHPVPRLAPGTQAHVYTTWVAHWHSHPELLKTGVKVYAKVDVAELDPDAAPPPDPPRIRRDEYWGGVDFHVKGASAELVRQVCEAQVAQFKADAAQGKAQP